MNNRGRSRNKRGRSRIQEQQLTCSCTLLLPLFFRVLRESFYVVRPRAVVPPPAAAELVVVPGVPVVVSVMLVVPLVP